ncbi:WD40 repeat-like protein [Trametes sanguinea]|nr:WD40 repeat-like protein [Trametes sanguinea]
MGPFHFKLPFSEHRSKSTRSGSPSSNTPEPPNTQSLHPDGEAQASSTTRMGLFSRISSRARQKEARRSPPPKAEHEGQDDQTEGRTSTPNSEHLGKQPCASMRQWPDTVINGITVALGITKEAGAAFPPLQAVAGSLLAITELVKQTALNADDICTLQTYIEQLNKVISPEVLPPPNQWPATFRERLSDLQSGLDKVNDELKLLSSEKWVGRVINAQERAGDIEGCIQSLGWLVQSFVVRGTIAMEFGITRVEVKIQEGMQHMDRKFDGVHAHMHGEFSGVHKHIDALSHSLGQAPSSIPGLHPTLSALYNDSESGRSECEPETRKEALATIFAWILGPNHPHLSAFPKPVLDVEHERLIMWLYALAGAGKSTLSQTTAQWCHTRRILAATFFCGRDGDRSNVLAIMPTIAYQLAQRCEIFREALRKAMAENPNAHQMSVASQLQKLIVEPLRAAREGGSKAFDNSVIVIDALDECTDDEAVSVVVKSLAQHHELLAPLRFLITSRPEPNIKAGFVIPALAANTQEFPLSRIPDELTARDIRHFLQNRLQDIGIRYSLDADWPSEDHVTRLVDLTELLFIFAATAVLYVGDKRARNPRAQLDRLLEAGRAAAALGSSKTSPFKILDALYTEVLLLGLKDLEEEPASQLKLMLGTIALAQERLRPETLEALLDLPSGTAMRLLPSLSAILALPSPGDESSPIRLIHASFADFIIDPSRCTERAFRITPVIHHTLLAERCLRVLMTLRHNVCEVDPEYNHLLNSEIPGLPAKIARHLPLGCQYAIKYWAYHLLCAQIDRQLLETLQAFSLLYDCERIVRAFYEGISASFFEVLRATATFAPLNSLLRQRHAADLPGTLLLRRGRDTIWSGTLTTSASNSHVLCLDVSPNGNLIAYGTSDCNIELRSVQTGAEVIVMKGHSEWVSSVSFSPDGKAILSGDTTGRIKLWDFAAGACLGTWQMHSDKIYSVAWSFDGTLAASASEDRTVRLWTIASPEEPATLCGHKRRVWTVVFAPDGALLSASSDKTCKIWATNTKSLVRTLNHDSNVYSVAVSPDSQLVACGLRDGKIALWSKADEAAQPEPHTLPGPTRVIALAFYANDTLAVAYGDSTFALWNVDSPAPFKALLDRYGVARAAAFSTDGIHIAVSVGNAVHITQWPTDAPRMRGQNAHSPEPPASDNHATTQEAADRRERLEVLSVSVSPNGRLIAAVLRDKVGLLDVSTGEFAYTLEHWSRRPIAPIAWSSSMQLVAWGDEGDVCIWETSPCGSIRVLTGHSGPVRAVTFTSNEEEVVSASEDGTIRRWNALRNSSSAEIVFQCEGEIHAVAMSSDGKWMVSGSADQSPPDTSALDLPSEPVDGSEHYYPTVRLHDAAGRVLWNEYVDSYITAVAFSDDCTRAVAYFFAGRMLLIDLSQFISPAADLSTPVLHSEMVSIVPEHECNTGRTRSDSDAHISSPDVRGIVSTTSYTSLEAKQSPLFSYDADFAFRPTYFFRSGWLWYSIPNTGCRRVCWVPSSLTRDMFSLTQSWSVQGDTIACTTEEKGLVILEASLSKR